MFTKGILGTKGNTEQVFSETGDRIPVTEIQTSPCFVVDVKTMDNHGYWAVVLAVGISKSIKKPVEGKFKKAGIKTPLHFLKEIRFVSAEEILEGKKKGLKIGELELMIGEELKASELFAAGDMVTVTGTSKGKGFQGVIKRHGFAGGPKTHGQSDRERSPGSIGMSATPGRVFKGKRMAGRMGTDTITIKNLEVIDVTDGSIFVKGLLPGVKNGYIVVRSASALPEKPAEEEQPVEETPVETQEAPKQEVPVEDTKAEEPVKEEKTEEPAQEAEKAEEK